MFAGFVSLLLLPIMFLNLPLMQIGFDDGVPSYQRLTAGYALIVEAALLGILAVAVNL